MTPADKTQSLARAISLLDCFSGEHPELGVREASRLVNLSSSTTGRLLTHLKDLGVLSQNPVTHAYSLGAKILAWSGVYTANLDIRNKALAAMHKLHEATQETISLYVLEGNERVCIERIESTQNVRIIARIGRRLPLYAGSAGKVFLAFLSPTRRDEILNSAPLVPFTNYTIVKKDEMLSELLKIHRDGYAVSHGEWTADASGVAAPIFDLNGEIIAALTISGPTQRFTLEAISQYTQEVTHAAKIISNAMGYTQ
jgi:IclR family transcriptional regulator, KDG regulon repressor